MLLQVRAAEAALMDITSGSALPSALRTAADTCGELEELTRRRRPTTVGQLPHVGIARWGGGAAEGKGGGCNDGLLYRI